MLYFVAKNRNRCLHFEFAAAFQFFTQGLNIDEGESDNRKTDQHTVKKSACCSAIRGSSRIWELMEMSSIWEVMSRIWASMSFGLYFILSWGYLQRYDPERSSMRSTCSARLRASLNAARYKPVCNFPYAGVDLETSIMSER